jgi:hypothetical protein
MSISPQLGGEHRVEIPAGAISYRACGDGSPIVFVHGVGVNGDLWRRLAGIGKAEHPDHRVSVELPGIEPGSYGIPSRLLRAQFAMPLLGSPGHAN